MTYLNSHVLASVLRHVMLALAFVLIAAACSDPRPYQYIADDTTGLLLQVPRDWEIVESPELMAVSASIAAQSDRALGTVRLIGFGENYQGGAVVSAVDTPAGYAVTRVLTGRELDHLDSALSPRGMSTGMLLTSIRDAALIPAGSTITIDSPIQARPLEQLDRAQLYGFAVTASLVTPVGEADALLGFAVDHVRGTVTTVVVGCSVECVAEHRSELEQIVLSLTINEYRPPVVGF